MDSLGQFGVRVLNATGFQLLWVCGPLIVCGVILHLLERTTSRLLIRTFGWRSILFTGWIGTPIHELSHAAMCPLFRHRIDEIKLFQPDLREGLLGYVKHSYNPRSLWATIGQAFIGLAPLFGGALALYAVTWALVPGAPLDDLTQLRGEAFADTSGVIDQGLASLRLSGAVLGAVAKPAHMTTWTFWVFVYLVVCIGAHMAPSRMDLHGSAKGIVVLFGLLVTTNIVLEAAAGGADTGTVLSVASATSPLVALLTLAIVLNTAVCALVWLLSRLRR